MILNFGVALVACSQEVFFLVLHVHGGLVYSLTSCKFAITVM